MAKPRVSVVIVNWKTPELLLGCLKSIYADPKSDTFEIWVVDNASGDDSVRLVLQYFPSVKLLANTKNVGFAKACNQVIPLARAPYVLLLNPDTIVVDQAISKMADYLDRNPSCGSVGPKVLNADGTLQLACRRSFPSPAAAFFRLTYLSRLFPKNATFAQYNLTYSDPDSETEVDALSGSCMMVRAAAIDRIGLLDEDIFMFGEDIDWCWRLKQQGWTVMYSPDSVVYHYHGAASRLRPVGATINLHKGMEVFYRKHLAAQHNGIFNAAVYAAIWLRAAVFVVLRMLSQMVPSRKGAGVFSSSINAPNGSFSPETMDFSPQVTSAFLDVPPYPAPRTPHSSQTVNR